MDSADSDIMDDLVRLAVLISQQFEKHRMLERLLDAGVSAGAATNDRSTLLHYAAYRNCIENAKVLIDRGTDVSAGNDQGLTPLHITKDAEMTSLLLDSGARVDAQKDDGSTPLHSACFLGLTNNFELLLNSGANVDAQENAGLTPLYFACLNGHAEIAQSLIGKGAS